MWVTVITFKVLWQGLLLAKTSLLKEFFFLIKNSTTNYLRLIEVTLGICSFEITKKNHPKHLWALDPNYSLCKAASKIAGSVLWLNIAPWAVKAPQYSLHCKCISNPISPKGLGDTHSLLREKQDLKHRVHPGAGPCGVPWEPLGGEIHSLSKQMADHLNDDPKMPGLVCTSCCSLGFGCPQSALPDACVLLEGRCPKCCFQKLALCEAVSSGVQREQKPFCHMLASVKYQQFSLWWTITILEKRPTDLGRVFPHPGTPPRAYLLTTPQTVTGLVTLLPNLGWALKSLRCCSKGSSVMLLVTTARCYHTCVRPEGWGFQSLLMYWSSWRPLGRGI